MTHEQLTTMLVQRCCALEERCNALEKFCGTVEPAIAKRSKVIGQLIKGGIHEQAMRQSIARLEKKIEELETQFAELPSLSTAYRGVWDEMKAYRRGEFVTLDGALWHANCTTMARPGKNGHWRLAVKSADLLRLLQPYLDAFLDAQKDKDAA